jgi:hypothetical protein
MTTKRELITLAFTASTQPEVKRILQKVLAESEEPIDEAIAGRPALPTGTHQKRSDGHVYVKQKDGRWKRLHPNVSKHLDEHSMKSINDDAKKKR